MLSSIFAQSRFFFLLIFISIALLIIDKFTILNLPKTALGQITLPIQYGLYKTGQEVKKQFEFIFQARRSAQEFKAIQEQMGGVLSENARLRSRVAELEGIVALESSLNPQTYNFVAARPIGLSRYLTIDRGSNDGLKVDQVVVYKDSYLGMIKEVQPSRSVVLLSSDPDSKIASFVSSGESKAKGILTGQFGSQLLLDKVLHQETLNVGDLVYSEGTEGKLPRGLIVGQVAEVKSIDNEVFKSAVVKQMFDIPSLDIVFVITN